MISMASVEKAAKDILKKTEKLFSAAKYEEIINAGYDFSSKCLEHECPELTMLSEDLIKGAIENPGWYQEMIHGRISHNRFKSNYPILHKTLLMLNMMCMPLEPIWVSSSTSLAVEYMQLIRNQIMIRNWEKYRKAYVFDKDLSKDLMSMTDIVELPLELPSHLPFPYVYIELPNDIPELESYNGVYLSILQESGIKRISSENVKILNLLVNEYKEKNFFNAEPMENSWNTFHWLLKQYEYNETDAKRVTGDDYISLHLLFVGRSKDEMGFNETFTYIMPLSANEEKICKVDKDYITEKVQRDEFDDKENLPDVIMWILNALMYLGAANADIETKKVKGALKIKPKDPKNKNNKKKKIEFIDTDVEVNSCGFMYGAKIRAYREQLEKEDREYEIKTGKRRPVRPHPVRGHYQRYHKGKGREKIEWILKAPHYNYGGVKADKTPLVNVSEVEK